MPGPALLSREDRKHRGAGRRVERPLNYRAELFLLSIYRSSPSPAPPPRGQAQGWAPHASWHRAYLVVSRAGKSLRILKFRIPRARARARRCSRSEHCSRASLNSRAFKFSWTHQPQSRSIRVPVADPRTVSEDLMKVICMRSTSKTENIRFSKRNSACECSSLDSSEIDLSSR